MQARIRKSEIVSFKEQSGTINTSKVSLPILKFLKIDIEGDFCSITKSNHESFIIKTFGNDSEDCSFLVSEDTLYHFVNYCDSEYINFLIDGTRIVLSGGHSSKVSSPTDSAKIYPSIDTANNAWISLPKLSLTSAGLASQIIFDGEIAGPKSYVFFGNGNVAGSDGSIGFLQPIKDHLPNLSLRRDVAQVVCKMTSCQHGSNESFDLFKENDTLYGFRKSEQPFFDLSPIFSRPEEGIDPDFVINKGLFSKWNTWVINTSGTKGKAAHFKCEDNRLILQMIDADNGLDFHDILHCKGGKGVFDFDPALMNKIIDICPCEELFFYPGKNRYYITDAEKTFISAIMLIAS